MKLLWWVGFVGYAAAHAIVGERHAAPGDALAVRTNRRQNGKRPRWGL